MRTWILPCAFSSVCSEARVGYLVKEARSAHRHSSQSTHAHAQSNVCVCGSQESSSPELSTKPEVLQAACNVVSSNYVYTFQRKTELCCGYSKGVRKSPFPLQLTFTVDMGTQTHLSMFNYAREYQRWRKQSQINGP